MICTFLISHEHSGRPTKIWGSYIMTFGMEHHASNCALLTDEYDYPLLKDSIMDNPFLVAWRYVRIRALLRSLSIYSHRKPRS